MARFWALGRPVGAICHGVLVLARTPDPATGRSVLAAAARRACPSTWSGRPTWPPAGGLAATTGRIPPMSRMRSRRRSTTRRASSSADRGARRAGTASDDGPAFTVTDGNYVSARWPGDAYLFARRFSALLASAAQPRR